MAKKVAKSEFSPSLYHNHILKNTTQQLAYDGGDVKTWQRKLKRKIKELLGDMPTEKVPLNTKSLWKRDHELGTIEKIVFTSEPHADVPAYVCIPKDVKPPYTFVICLQGHSTGMHNSIAVDFETEKKTLKIEGDRDFAITCMEKGYAALCIEQRSFGMRRENDQENHSQEMCHDASMQAILLGKTLVGQRVYDVDRGIDYIAERGDANMKTITVMGNSGGGTVTTFAAATLPRVKFAMPSCYFCTFEHSIMAMYHCACNYIPQIYKYAEMSDILGLFAPKPVVVVAGKDDPIFPVKAVRQQFKKLKAIYKAAGAENNCQLVVGPGEHRFYADQAWPKLIKQLKQA